jgi:hypothetical protein
LPAPLAPHFARVNSLGRFDSLIDARNSAPRAGSGSRPWEIACSIFTLQFIPEREAEPAATGARRASRGRSDHHRGEGIREWRQVPPFHLLRLQTRELQRRGDPRQGAKSPRPDEPLGRGTVGRHAV